MSPAISEIISPFDPDSPLQDPEAPLPTDPGASLLMGQMSHSDDQRIRQMLAENPAMGMADLALQLFKDGGTPDWPGFCAVLNMMGVDNAQIDRHLPEARALYALAIAANQKVLERVES